MVAGTNFRAPPTVRKRDFTLGFSKTFVFHLQEQDSCLLTSMLSKLFTVVSCCPGRVFVHWSIGFCYSSIAPPDFSLGAITISKARLSTFIFSDLHRAFGATFPMVRRTNGFGAAKSILKTNWISTNLCCGVLTGTKPSFSPQDSHSILTMRFFRNVQGYQFF